VCVVVKLVGLVIYGYYLYLVVVFFVEECYGACFDCLGLCHDFGVYFEVVGE